MKIYNSSLADLWTASGIEPKKNPVISVVGAGGKTSLILHLSNELNKRKIFHYIATTTKMWPVDVKMYRKQIGPLDENGKVSPPSEEEWEMIFSSECPVLIEADGSKGLPCKAPESHEPVFREETTHVFGVLGMSCLNQMVREICHRPGKVQELLECASDHRLLAEDIEKLVVSPNGLQKNVKKEWSYQVVLNQVDDEAIYEQIQHIEENLRGEKIEHIWFTRMIEKTDKNNGDAV